MTSQSAVCSAPSRRPGRFLAGLALALGVAFVLNPVYLYTNAEQTAEFSIFFRFVNAALLLYGCCLVAAGWYGRRGVPRPSSADWSASASSSRSRARRT